ncbi:MAG: tRNA (adenosine(37)-N6)-threonylcarbamoyltransferase complex dimerization subunit type 1 TsaB [Acidobacteriota bacterium]|nr:tRNA (adenosine(37)-N6)-threonylcarbamoyltransferase complex dimerization subunit type 1 TsaB [Acidobacteriota bacterium]
MNLLAIETATTACAIGVRAGDLEREVVLDEHRRHTEVLAAGIAAALGERGLAPRDLDRVIVDRGPGLYTGLRVGLATADALARATGCDLVEVTSLEVLAHGAWARGVRGRLVTLVDARRGEVFSQTFDLGAGVSARPDLAVGRPDALAARLALEEGLTLTGDGAARYADLFAALPGATLDGARVPPPAAALALGATRDPVAAVTALYLRDPDAVANFVTRDGP